MPAETENSAYFDANYDLLDSWLVQPGQKIMLGDRKNRVCRFCGKTSPEVTFGKVAHAIPESLGNKSIESLYECDVCNDAFGAGIENDLGNWSKPLRTLARIRGKSGVPSIKRGGEKGWRIDYSADVGFQLTQYEDDPVFTVDEVNKKLHVELRRDPYTPVAVLKAFMKIGITLLPDNEVGNFTHLKNWVRDPDHSHVFVEGLPVLYAFRPGPLPPNLISAFILRRKSGKTGCPYAFLVLGYGNEVFQVIMPSAEHDGGTMNHAIYRFPVPGSTDPDRYGDPKYGSIDFMSREVKRGDIAKVTMGFEEARVTPPAAAP